MWQHWIHVLLFNGHRIFRHFSWCHLDAQVDIKFPAISHPNLLSLSSWALNFPPFPHYVVSMLKRTSKVPPFPTLTSFHCLNGHRIYRHFSWRSLNAQVDIKSPINVGLSVGDLRRVAGKTCRCWLGSDDDTTLPSPTPQVLPSPTDLSFLFPTPWNNGTPTHM